MSASYIDWLIRMAVEYDSLIIWHVREDTYQPILFPNVPFGWFDESQSLYDETEDDGGGRRRDVFD